MHHSRWICDILQEMRKCYETRNFASLLGLIEEAQTAANRIEAALETQRSYFQLDDQCKELEKKKKKLQREIDDKKA